jgi:hypothetical protein
VLTAAALVAVSGAAPVQQAAAADRECGYSRFPLAKDGLRYYYVLQVAVERGTTACSLSLRVMTSYVRDGKALRGWACRESSAGAVWRCRYLPGKAVVVARSLG